MYCCDKVYVYLFYINRKKGEELTKEGRGDTHQELMSAQRRIYYTPVPDYGILSITR